MNLPAERSTPSPASRGVRPAAAQSHLDAARDLGSACDSQGYDVFVSYKHGPDSDVARVLATRLRVAGFRVFFDEDVRTGQNLLQVIDEAIASARAVLLLWSSAARERSTNIAGELDAAKEAGTLMPVALDDTPFSTFFRALKVCRLVVNGVVDERAYNELRRDIGERCGRTPANNATRLPERPFSATASMLAHEPRILASACFPPGGARVPLVPGVVRGPNLRRQDRRGPHVRPAVASTDSTSLAAVRRAVEMIHRRGVWPADDAPPEILVVVRELFADSAARAVAFVDLSLPGVTRSMLCLFEEHLELRQGDESVRVGYADLVEREIALREVGYGFTATVAVEGLAALTVRGRQQATLLLEVLHDLREELSWIRH